MELQVGIVFTFVMMCKCVKGIASIPGPYDFTHIGE